MKNKIVPSGIAGLKLLLWVIAAILIYSCNSNKAIKSSFYYAGSTRVEITIMADTIGVLLKDTVLNRLDSSVPYFTKVIALADSNLSKQGYQSAGNMENDPQVKLILNPNGKYTKSSAISQIANVTGGANRLFVENAGFLVRIKESNKPMILTNELLIQFKQGSTTASIDKLLTTYNLSVLRRKRYDSLLYVVAVTRNSPHEILQMSHILKQNSIVNFAEINFIYVKKTMSTTPTDAYFSQQWNLASESSTVATEDADIDADLAWDLTMGSRDILIAVIDLGFDTLHQDLDPNIARNADETQGNDFDDDGNGYKDDYLGWNFNVVSGGGNNIVDGDQHGTAVLGVANAAANNNHLGISGSCPDCKSLLIKTGHTQEQDADAINYAIIRRANVINISWEFGAPLQTIVVQNANRAITTGIVIVFSMANTRIEYCSMRATLNQIPGAIAVSRSSSKDEYDNAAIGNCMSLLAPSGVDGSPAGYLKLLTTDIRSWRGYNTGTTDQFCMNVFRDADYTICFWGTSASAPLTAGVAGLILSANSTLGPQQVKYLLQDCADKIQNSSADYDPLNGKSRNQTHGYGRLNAYEAVKIASSNRDRGGRTGVDIFVRDHALDWGNTEKPSSYSFEPGRGTQSWWKSMDIRIAAPGTTIPPTLNNSFFESLGDNDLVGGRINKIFVRVRNRGFNPARDVSVKLHYADACLAFPALPGDFWTEFPANSRMASEWRVIGTQTNTSPLNYGGPSAINSGTGDVYIAEFDFDVPRHDETRIRNHYCLMAIIDSPDDPAKSSALMGDPLKLNMDNVTKNYNNATHRNFMIINSADDNARTQQFTLHNPYPYPIFTKPELKTSGKNPIRFADTSMNKAFTLKPGEKRNVRIMLDFTKIDSTQEITIQQVMYSGKDKSQQIIGGLTYKINPLKK